MNDVPFDLKTLIEHAERSDCAKLKFGAVATIQNIVLGYSYNHRLPHHRFLCEGECIRSKITSRTESMIGACGHAEEGLMWSLCAEGYDGYDLWVVQVKDGLIVLKHERSFSCARCSTAMYYAGVRGVWVYVEDHFEFLTTEEAIKSSYEFALGEKKA